MNRIIYFWICFVFCSALGLEVEKNSVSQFSYSYKTEIVHGDLNIGEEVSNSFTSFAERYFGHLNTSIFFEPSFIKDSNRTRNYHLREQYQKERKGRLLEFLTEDDIKICATYFDRKSDKLMIVGEGFTNDREVMSPFIDMFPDYDLVLFDFRGQGLEANYFSLSKRCFGVDSEYAKLGAVEEKDVYAVVSGMKKIKNYKQVYGLGLCYSAFIFLKALALRPGTFDKLILDGCWISVPMIVEKIKSDPKVIFDPQHGGWQDHFIFKNDLVQNFLIWISSNVLGFSLHGSSILEYVEKIDSANLLFFYGKNDLMVSRDEFELIWNAIKTPYKTAIITSNPHVRNHLKQKEAYRLFCELFLDHDYELFKKLVFDPKSVASMYSDRVLNFVS